jgi:hypothetical protein
MTMTILLQGAGHLARVHITAAVDIIVVPAV